MLKVAEAIARLRAAGSLRAGDEAAPLLECRGRILAEDATAVLDVPPAANSAMDGYALRRKDWHGTEQVIPISQRIAAGHPPQPLQEGTAARIFTGAEVPEGADVVVMQEDCTADAAGVKIRELPEPGTNIRPRGQDLKAGQLMLSQGHRLRAQDLGLLASQGIDRIRVRQRLRVAVISTGDELQEPGQPQQRGKIFNSNRYTLHGLLGGWGFEVIDLGIAPDREDSVRAMMREAAEAADVVITSGGVSVGEEDHVKSVVEQLGALDLWRVAIRPGKPFAFGHVLGKPFLGLPGNPVSVFVTLLVLGRPYLLACQGARFADPQPSRRIAAFDLPPESREVYLRVRSARENGGGNLELFASQSSGVLMSTSWGEGLVRQPLGQPIKAGDEVDFLPWSQFD